MKRQEKGEFQGLPPMEEISILNQTGKKSFFGARSGSDNAWK
jgi:hypothetical protein